MVSYVASPGPWIFICKLLLLVQNTQTYHAQVRIGDFTLKAKQILRYVPFLVQKQAPSRMKSVTMNAWKIYFRWRPNSLQGSTNQMNGHGPLGSRHEGRSQDDLPRGPDSESSQLYQVAVFNGGEKVVVF